MNRFAWFGIGLVILLVIAETDSTVGGWLLVVTVLGLLYNAHEKGLI